MNTVASMHDARTAEQIPANVELTRIFNSLQHAFGFSIFASGVLLAFGLLLAVFGDHVALGSICWFTQFALLPISLAAISSLIVARTKSTPL